MNRAAPLILLIALSGCAASNGHYPSLLPRMIEQRDDSEPVHTPAVAAPDATLDAKVRALRSTLEQSAADFASTRIRATPLVEAARGASVGSDAWLTAQATLSGLDAARGESLGALAEIDRIVIERAQAGLPPYPALDTARDAGEAQSNQQSATIDALHRLLPQS